VDCDGGNEAEAEVFDDDVDGAIEKYDDVATVTVSGPLCISFSFSCSFNTSFSSLLSSTACPINTPIDFGGLLCPRCLNFM